MDNDDQFYSREIVKHTPVATVKALPPNIRTAICCLMCTHAKNIQATRRDNGTITEVTHCDKYKLAVQTTLLCDSFERDEEYAVQSITELQQSKEQFYR